MELRESIESINYSLEKEFGRAFNNSPNFRVVFADDQFEKRWTSFTDEGIELLHPEVRELPKYQWCKGRFVLERYIPIVGETDLTVKENYEPAWIFQDRFQNYLPPRFDACKFVIEGMYETMGHKGHVKYKDPEATEEARLERIVKMEETLFGNETPVGDHLAYGTGVVVPSEGQREEKSNE